jgi:hypothetical protein
LLIDQILDHFVLHPVSLPLDLEPVLQPYRITSKKIEFSHLGYGACSLVYVHSQYGDGTLLRNFCKHLLNYTASRRRIHYSSCSLLWEHRTSLSRWNSFVYLIVSDEI